MGWYLRIINIFSSISCLLLSPPVYIYRYIFSIYIYKTSICAGFYRFCISFLSLAFCLLGKLLCTPLSLCCVLFMSVNWLCVSIENVSGLVSNKFYFFVCWFLFCLISPREKRFGGFFPVWDCRFGSKLEETLQLFSWSFECQKRKLSFCPLVSYLVWELGEAYDLS